MQKVAAILAAILSVAVFFSKVTFFNEKSVLFLFAQFVNLAKENYDYFVNGVMNKITINLY